MLSSLQCQFAQVKVRVWGGGDDDDIDRGVLQQVFGRAIGLDSGVIFLGIVVGFGSALHDSIQLEFRNLRDEGDVKDLCAEAVADNADVPYLGGHAGGQWGGLEVERCR